MKIVFNSTNITYFEFKDSKVDVPDFEIVLEIGRKPKKNFLKAFLERLQGVFFFSTKLGVNAVYPQINAQHYLCGFFSNPVSSRST